MNHCQRCDRTISPTGAGPWLDDASSSRCRDGEHAPCPDGIACQKWHEAAPVAS